MNSLSEESHSVEADNVIDNSKKMSFLLSRWRMSSTKAVSSANRVLLATASATVASIAGSHGSGTAGAGSGAAVSNHGVVGGGSGGGGSMHNTLRRVSTNGHEDWSAAKGTFIDHEYSEPFVVYKMLLEGSRQIQKQFFPPQHNAAAANTSSTPLAMHLRRTSMSPSSNKSQSPPPLSSSSSASSDHVIGSSSLQTCSISCSSSDSVMSSVSGPKHAGNLGCNGLSDALRIEIAATLNLNAGVNTKDIETVDRAFAFACANQLEKLITALVRLFAVCNYIPPFLFFSSLSLYLLLPFLFTLSPLTLSFLSLAFSPLTLVWVCRKRRR